MSSLRKSALNMLRDASKTTLLETTRITASTAIVYTGFYLYGKVKSNLGFFSTPKNPEPNNEPVLSKNLNVKS